MPISDALIDRFSMDMIARLLISFEIWWGNVFLKGREIMKKRWGNVLVKDRETMKDLCRDPEQNGELWTSGMGPKDFWRVSVMSNSSKKYAYWGGEVFVQVTMIAHTKIDPGHILELYGDTKPF